MGTGTHDEDFEGDVQEAALPLGDSPIGRRGRGRPPGALNKKTKALAEYLAGLGYRDPAIILAETYSRPAAELAGLLDCKLSEAFKLQLDAAASLMPYLHGKMPTEILVTDERLPLLIMDLGTNMVEKRRELASRVMALGLPLEGVEYQSLSEGENRQSHGEQSHGDDK